jgi:hypothetical protein
MDAVLKCDEGRAVDEVSLRAHARDACLIIDEAGPDMMKMKYLGPAEVGGFERMVRCG